MSEDDVQEIKSSIRGLHGQLNQIANQLSATVAVLSVHVDTLQKHDDDLNCKDGIKTRTTRLEGTVGTIVWGVRALWGVLASLAAVLVSWLLG